MTLLARHRLPLCVATAVALITLGRLGQSNASAADAGDWPQWGGSPARNSVSSAKNLPTKWEVGEFDQASGKWLGSDDKQIRWVARLGSETYGSPVVAGGKVFCATNNGAGYLKRYPAKVDLGCLLCFRQSDGKFLWQYSAEKLRDRDVDWPKQGICCSPLVEGNRVWIVDSRGQIVCMDTEGFHDGKNDGPVQDEPAGPEEADIIWRFDMMGRLGTQQRYMSACSVTVVGDLLLAGTSHGVNTAGKNPNPKAPSFLALDKNSGKLVWSDNSPNDNILEGQWSSPAVAQLDSQRQAIFAAGDGWLYSFRANSGQAGRPDLLWRFDCNPKEAVWETGGTGTRNQIIATPVVHEGRVYIGTGQDPEAGEGPGDLWCIDVAKAQGDASAQLVVNAQGKPVHPRRTVAVDAAAGEKAIPNPHSAAVWHYRGSQSGAGSKGGKADFKQVMHRTLGSVAVHEGLAIVGDFAGLVHCLDAATGKPLWTHDLLSAVWGGALIADGKVYLGTEDGDVAVFAFARQCKVLAKNSLGNSCYSTPVAVGRTLYIATRGYLFAIGTKD